MHDFKKIEKLLASLYEAPGTEAGWMAFLRKLNAVVHGSGTHFISAVSNHRRGSVLLTSSAPPEALADYAAYWGAFDPWGVSSDLYAAAPQTVIPGGQMIAPHEFRRTGYYTDFARRYDFVRAVVGVIENDDGRVSVVSINRGERQDEFQAHEEDILRVLLPHMLRALQLFRRLSTGQEQSERLEDAISSLNHGVLLVDAGGRLIYASDEAARVLAAHDGLVLDAGELRCGEPATTRRLRELVHDAASTSLGHGIGSGGSLVIRRSSGRPLLLVVSPVTAGAQRGEACGAKTAAAMLVVSDPDRNGITDPDNLRGLFGLTSAEAQLTILVADGVSLTDAASRLGITVETARTRLRAVFDKTQVHRQGELTALVRRHAVGAQRATKATARRS